MPERKKPSKKMKPLKDKPSYSKPLQFDIKTGIKPEKIKPEKIFDMMGVKKSK
jgi:hypothetical protein